MVDDGQAGHDAGRRRGRVVFVFTGRRCLVFEESAYLNCLFSLYW